jgi:hypothetical protein
MGYRKLPCISFLSLGTSLSSVPSELEERHADEALSKQQLSSYTPRPPSDDTVNLLHSFIMDLSFDGRKTALIDTWLAELRAQRDVERIKGAHDTAGSTQAPKRRIAESETCTPEASQGRYCSDQHQSSSRRGDDLTGFSQPAKGATVHAEWIGSRY